MRSIIRLLATARELRPWYVGIVVTSVGVAATALLTPFIIKAATDEVLAQVGGSGGGVRALVWLAVALLVVELANTGLTNLGGYLGDTMTVRLRAILSSRYYAKLLSLPQRYFDTQLTGTVISRLQRSISETTQFLQMFANSFFPTLITVGAVLAVAVAYSWPLALLLLVIYPLFAWLTTLTSKRWQKLEQVKNREFDVAGGRFAEAIGQIRVVKSFVREREELTSFDDHYASAVGVTSVQSRWWHLMDVARRGALNVIFFGIYVIIFVQTAEGAWSLGVMVLLIQLVAMARQPVMMMSYLVDSSQRAVAGTRDYFAVMDELPEPNEVDADPHSPDLSADRVALARARVLDGPAGATAPGASAPPPEDEDEEDDTPITERPAASPAPRPDALRRPAWPVVPGTPAVEFDHVTFGYDEAARVLHDVAFAVSPGERVAFVGESGGGKTTLVNLLLGLYRPDHGTVRLFGTGVGGVPLQTLRSQIGVVFQDASLFSGTIRENITYGRPDATDAEVELAARRANAHDFIARLGRGYDSEIGERGIKLSGGQKQRIAVARAMLKDAPILVLDEATSALDSKSERLVQAGLEELMADRTSLIIAHRLSTISSVDRIVTLAEGRVDEIGTPSELARTGGIYSELLALQASASRADRLRLAAFDITG